jgi:FMN phosphatase YigB (HAD superfamily)
MNDVIAPEQLGLKAVWLRDIFDWPPGHPLPKYSIQALSELHDLI